MISNYKLAVFLILLNYKLLRSRISNYLTCCPNSVIAINFTKPNIFILFFTTTIIFIISFHSFEN